jgi:molybdenum cofactor synthesis domain-containing protein
MTRATVITVSDSRSAGAREDLSGPAIARVLRAAGFDVKEIVVVPDEQSLLEAELRRQASSVPLVVTTGGTGIAPRDVTPEATRAVCERLLDGVAEQMRHAGLAETPFSVLSRGVCGTVGRSIILNLPGNPQGAVTSLGAVVKLLPHALRLLEGQNPHEDPDHEQTPGAISAGISSRDAS